MAISFWPPQQVETPAKIALLQTKIALLQTKIALLETKIMQQIFVQLLSTCPLPSVSVAGCFLPWSESTAWGEIWNSNVRNDLFQITFVCFCFTGPGGFLALLTSLCTRTGCWGDIVQFQFNGECGNVSWQLFNNLRTPLSPWLLVARSRGEI